MTSTHDLVTWGLAAGGLVLGSTGLWALLKRRAELEAEAPGEAAKASAELAGAAAEFTKQFGEAAGGFATHLLAEVGRLTVKVDKCEERHAGCETRLELLAGRLDHSEREREELKAKIEDLMSGPPASY